MGDDQDKPNNPSLFVERNLQAESDAATAANKLLIAEFDPKQMVYKKKVLKNKDTKIDAYFEETPNSTFQAALVWFCQKEWSSIYHIQTLVDRLEHSGQILSAVDTLVALFYTYLPITEYGPNVAVTSDYWGCGKPALWRLPLLRRVASPAINFDNPLETKMEIYTDKSVQSGKDTGTKQKDNTEMLVLPANILKEFFDVISPSIYIPDYSVILYEAQRSAEILNMCCSKLKSENLLSEDISRNIVQSLKYSEGAIEMLKYSDNLQYTKILISCAFGEIKRAQEKCYASLRRNIHH